MLELPFEPPVQQLEHPLFAAKQVSVHMKREDLVHPFISGNKWRKLKYVLADARAQDKNLLVSFGGAYSNHLVALACAGAMCGFKTVAFVRGEAVSNHMLGLCKTWGMQLHFVSRELYRDKDALFNRHFSDHPEAYYIDEGGRGELAMQGCAEILNSVQGFTHVSCACGTGTTLAGLSMAAQAKGMQADGIAVLKHEALDEDVRKLVPALHNWRVHHGYERGGYAKTDAALMSFIRDFAGNTGILLDQVYTAKMMMAVLALLEQDHYAPGSRLLLVHTGGLLGLLSQV